MLKKLLYGITKLDFQCLVSFPLLAYYRGKHFNFHPRGALSSPANLMPNTVRGPRKNPAGE